MTSQGSQGGRVPVGIWSSLLVVRGGYGFTLGLYLYVTQLVLLDALERAGMPNAERVAWSTWVLAFLITWDAFMEYPTGVVADLCGRKFAMTLGFVFRGLFFLAFLGVWAAGRGGLGAGWVLPAVFGSWVLFGVGYGLLSGTTTAWLNDALDEADCRGRLTGVLAWGNCAYWVTFLFGSLIALLLYNARLEPVLFVLGFGVSVVVAVLCTLLTGENKFYQFRRISDFLGTARRKVWAEYNVMVFTGVKLFWADKARLGIITLVGAAIHTLRDFIDYSWASYCRDQLGVLKGTENITEFGRLTWLVLALTALYLFGHLAVMSLIGRWERRSVEVSGVRLTGLNIALNLLFSLPLIGLFIGLTVFVVPDSSAGFAAFASLIALYAFFQGASDSPRESLDNAYIPPRTQERSTVLSLISFLRKAISAVVVVVVGLLVSDTQSMIKVWAVMAGVVLVLTLMMPLVMRGQYALPEDVTADPDIADEAMLNGGLSEPAAEMR